MRVPLSSQPTRIATLSKSPQAGSVITPARHALLGKLVPPSSLDSMSDKIKDEEKTTALDVPKKNVVFDGAQEHSSEVTLVTSKLSAEYRLSSLQKSKSLASCLNVQDVDWRYRRPNIVGHRGSVYHALENTINGFQISSEIGCDAVELDVFLLRCGELVVFHGVGTDQNPGCLREYCNIEGSILDFTAKEARQMRFNPYFDEFVCGPECVIKGHEKGHNYIPTLEEVLLELRDSTELQIKIELKGPNTEIPTLELVERLGMVDRCHFSSFKHSRIRRIRDLRPMLKEDGTHKYRTGALFSYQVPTNFVETALAHGASEVHLRYDTCTVERINAIHNAGMSSMAWFRGPRGMRKDVAEKYHDVGNEDEKMYKTVMATGVESMCINKPDVVLDMIRRTNHLIAV